MTARRRHQGGYVPTGGPAAGLTPPTTKDHAVTDTITHNVNAEDCGPCLDGHDDETGRAYHQGVQDGQNFVLNQLEAMTAGYTRESPHMAAGRDILAQARRLTNG